MQTNGSQSELVTLFIFYPLISPLASTKPLTLSFSWLVLLIQSSSPLFFSFFNDKVQYYDYIFYKWVPTTGWRGKQRTFRLFLHTCHIKMSCHTKALLIDKRHLNWSRHLYVATQCKDYVNYFSNKSLWKCLEHYVRTHLRKSFYLTSPCSTQFGTIHCN